MKTRKTSLAIDEELLAEAQAILGTSTLRDTVEQALLEVVKRRARREEIRRLSRMEDLDLADATIMSKAWRR